MSLVQFVSLRRPNTSSGVPVHIQLMDQVKQGIESGAFRPGEPLPGIRPLAEELVINPNVVAKAYRALASEGVVDLRDDAGALLAFTRGIGESSGATTGGRAALAATERDRRLTELTRENTRLASTVAAEAAQRASRDRELETAREVQQRLFPRQQLQIAGLDYAGVCRPALGVGGDYYDFIRLSDTELAIAIGDVCGKGIPAALLMATLRAHLHGETQRQGADPARIMATLNRLVCEVFSPNRFASFFYAHYDSSTRTLRYVNAGHNAPFVFGMREGRPVVFRLDRGGPVVGLVPDCAYAEERLTLEPGDLLVAFTDGITEAMNEDDDEWGEERLEKVADAHRELPARQIIDRIIGEADAFVDGASQHDDMTLVTVRIA